MRDTVTYLPNSQTKVMRLFSHLLKESNHKSYGGKAKIGY